MRTHKEKGTGEVRVEPRQKECIEVSLHSKHRGENLSIGDLKGPSQESEIK